MLDMSKPFKQAIAVVLRDSTRPRSFLVVKRPEDDPELGGYWGLPATSMRPGELPEDAARRVCREKLGCDAVPLRLVGTMFQKRTAYDMFFMDIEMLLISGKPDVRSSHSAHTVYAEQRWTINPRLLVPSAQQGSCCSTIFLTYCGIMSRDDWVLSVDTDNVTMCT
jgi:8-oxo-dGTP diphosphatase